MRETTTADRYIGAQRIWKEHQNAERRRKQQQPQHRVERPNISLEAARARTKLAEASLLQ